MEGSESLGDRCGEGGSIFREEGARGHQGSLVGWAVPMEWQGLIQMHTAAQAARKGQAQAGKQEQGILNSGKLQPGNHEEHVEGCRLYSSCSAHCL